MLDKICLSNLPSVFAKMVINNECYIVIVSLSGYNGGWICFVEASSNLALHKPAFESSDYECYNASYAVDGVRDFADCKIAHTVFEKNPWWAVDLGSTTYVVNVTITPQTGK